MKSEKLHQMLIDLEKAMAASQELKTDTVTYMIGIAIAQVQYEIDEERKKNLARH